MNNHYKTLGLGGDFNYYCHRQETKMTSSLNAELQDATRKLEETKGFDPIVTCAELDPQEYVRRETYKRAHNCLLYTSPSPRDLSTSRMPSSA